MTIASVMKDVREAKQLIGVAEKMWAIFESGHADTHALGQALIEAGTELQNQDPVKI